MKHILLSFLFGLISLGVLVSCAPLSSAGESAQALNAVPQNTQIAILVETLAAESTRAALVLPHEETPVPLSFEHLPPEDAPLRFTFPTPQAEPVSLWRPPLYDTPWALTPYDHFYFTRPIAADVVNWPLDDYRYGAQFPGLPDVIHTGIDIPAPRNTPILAAGPGVVMWAGWDLFDRRLAPSEDPYGIAVAVKHDFGYEGRRLYTVYAHMDRVDVVPGQRVAAGDPLGIIGDTGFTTGPHLHFEVRIETNGFFASRNPELWLAPPEGWGVLAGRMMNTNGSLLIGQSLYIRNLATNERWKIHSYTDTLKVTSDEYYRENVVLSDLPAGEYEISLEFEEETWYTSQVSINPGAITYFTFRGDKGFHNTLPPTPVPDGLPES